MGEDVSLEVVHFHHGGVLGDGEAFGEGDAYQQGAEQSGAAGDGDAVDLFGADAGVFQGGIDDGDDILSVGS